MRRADAAKLAGQLVKLGGIIGRLEAERDQLRRERDELRRVDERPNPMPKEAPEGIWARR